MSNIVVSYSGSQVGFSVRDQALEQKSYTNTDVDYNSIAAGLDNDLYLVDQNHIYHYTQSGELLKDMDFDDSDVDYVGVAVKDGMVARVYAA